MASNYARSPDFRSPDCRLSFAHTLYKPQKNESGTDKWGCTLIFPKTARAALETHVAQVLKDTWGEAGIQRAKNGLIKSPFLAGDGKEARSKKTGELHPGMNADVFFIRPSSNRPPLVRYTDPNTPVDETVVYSGCYGFAVLNAFAWHNEKNGDGVSFGIQYFQKLRDGERLGGSGGVDPEAWYEKVEHGDAPAETRNGDGAASLFG